MNKLNQFSIVRTAAGQSTCDLTQCTEEFWRRIFNASAFRELTSVTYPADNDKESHSSPLTHLRPVRAVDRSRVYHHGNRYSLATRASSSTVNVKAWDSDCGCPSALLIYSNSGVSTSDWFIVNVSFPPSLHLGHVGRTADSFSPLCLCGELRSHRYFQDVAWHHWLHCPNMTSSCTFWLCRILFQTTGPQFNALPQDPILDSHTVYTVWLCRWLLLLSWSSILASEGFTPATTENEQARGPDNISPRALKEKL